MSSRALRRALEAKQSLDSEELETSQFSDVREEETMANRFSMLSFEEQEEEEEQPRQTPSPQPEPDSSEIVQKRKKKKPKKKKQTELEQVGSMRSCLIDFWN